MLLNRSDKFSVETARLGDGNEKEDSYPIRTKRNVSKKQSNGCSTPASRSSVATAKQWFEDLTQTMKEKEKQETREVNAMLVQAY